MTWWQSQDWFRYEELCGDEPGTRTRLLAAATWQTRVVDLSVSEAELWRGVRRSYHALIHRAEKSHFIKPWTNEYMVGWARLVHLESAGRATRPTETWELMNEWAVEGQAACIGAVRRGVAFDAVGYVYCVIHGTWAYYFSSASVVKDINHALLWTAMKALKARGIRYLELGWQGEAHDAKGKQIEWFKTGFGGYDIAAKEGPALCEL